MIKYSHIELKQTRQGYKNEISNLKLTMNGKKEFDSEVVLKIRGIVERIDEIDKIYDRDFEKHDVESEAYQKIYSSYTSMLNIKSALTWVAGSIVTIGIIWAAIQKVM